MVAQFTHSGNLQTFDIRNFTDTLTPAKEKNKFICPNCEGHNLSIEPETGKYQCFNGCTNREVREVIRPWSEVVEARKTGDYTPTHKPKTKPVPKPKPAPIPDILDIATIPNPTPPETITQGEDTITTYKYSGSAKVVRTDNPHKKKTVFPYYLDNDGWVKGKGEGIEWPPYRLTEVVNFGKGKWVLIVEGEQCTDIARVNFGIVTTTFQGGSWGEDLSRQLPLIKNAGVAGVIIWPDHDDAGYKKAQKIADIAAKIQLPLIELDPLKLWDAMPDKGDIVDFLEAHKNMTGDDLIAILKEQISKANISDADDKTENDDGSIVHDGEVWGFSSAAFNALYSDGCYIASDDKLYKWDNSYYQELEPAIEKSRILSYCSRVIVYKRGKKTYPFDTPESVEKIYKYACIKLGKGKLIPPANVVNCTNGVLSFTWEDKDLKLNFESHNPEKHYFTDKPIIAYNPIANTQYADQLLSCLDAPQRDILIKTLGASLDVKTVRKYQGRNLKILFAIGQGQNGKDSINKVIRLIYQGKGTTSYQLDDFIQYDQGNKSAIAGLINSRVNWPSESSRTTRIDNSVSLKCLATGDTLISRYLYKDGVEYSPNCIGIFNLNEFPNIFATGDAAKSRYSFLHFAKSYVDHPTKVNELKADTRFHDDTDWVINEVAPAFLNYMIDGLQRLVKEGIDHSCNAQILQNIQGSNNHLFEFCQEMNVNFQEGAEVKSKDLMALLKQFYLDNDIVTIDDSGRENYSDPIKPSDKYIKSTNQLNPRILEIFPKAEITKEYDPVSKRKVPVFKNILIGVVNEESSTKIPAPPAPHPHPYPHPETTIYQETRTTRTTFPKLLELEKNNDQQSTNTQPIAQPINQNPEIQTTEFPTKEKFGESGAGGAGMPENQGFCGAGEASNGAGTGAGGAGIFVLPYQVEDDVICYPNVDYAERKKQVKAKIVRIEYSGQFLVSCDVEFTDKNGARQKATIGGGSSEWLLKKVR
jgi:putative DNA primase/helicase